MYITVSCLRLESIIFVMIFPKKTLLQKVSLDTSCHFSLGSFSDWMQLSSLPEGTEDMQIWKRSVVCLMGCGSAQPFVQESRTIALRKRSWILRCKVSRFKCCTCLVLLAWVYCYLTVNRLVTPSLYCLCTDLRSGFNLEPTVCLGNIV